MTRHLLLLLLLAIGQLSAAQSNDQPLYDTATVSEHTFVPQGIVLNLENDDNYATFSTLDSAAGKFSIFLTGEDHRFENSNVKMELKMLKYFHRFGARVYLMEAGYISGWILNRYIQTGDSTLEAIQDLYYYKNFSRLFHNIKDFNQLQDAENRIQASGIDLERNMPISVKMLEYFLPADKEIPDSLLLFVESLRTLAGYLDGQALAAREQDGADNDDLYDYDYNDGFFYNPYNSVAVLVKDYKRLEPYFRDYLDSNYTLFNRCVQEMDRWLTWTDYTTDNVPQSWVYREQYMANNFRKLYAQNPGTKYYGQFGRCHTSQIRAMRDCNFVNFKSLTQRIRSFKEIDPERNIFTIGIFYPRSGDFYTLENKDNSPIDLFAEHAVMDSITLYPVITDSTISTQLGNKFNMLIVNNISLEDDLNSDIDSAVVDDRPGRIRNAYDKGSTFGFYFGASGFNFDFTALSSQAGVDIPGNVIASQFEIGGGVNGGFQTYLGYTNISEMSYNLNDTALLGLRGHQFRAWYGVDLVKSKKVDVVPLLGYGYSVLQMEYTDKQRSNGFFGENIVHTYRNPAFSFDARLNVQVNVRRIALSVFGGYSLDISKTAWKSSGSVVTSPVKTSLSAPYYGARVGFLIDK